MQLTQHTEYALRLLMFLATHQDQMPTVGAVSAAYGISENHLAAVSKRLVDAGLVEAKRGRGGGLRLAKSPEEIRIGPIVRELENLRLVECFDKERNSCPLAGPCKLQSLLAEAAAAFLGTLDAVTLEELVANRPQLLHKLTRHRSKSPVKRVVGARSTSGGEPSPP